MSRDFKRLTPTVVGESGAFLFPHGRVVVGFVTGGPTNGAGFPQWAFKGGGSANMSHYYEMPNSHGKTLSICGRMFDWADRLFMPGNFQRCKDCERQYTKKLRKQGLTR